MPISLGAAINNSGIYRSHGTTPVRPDPGAAMRNHPTRRGNRSFYRQDLEKRTLFCDSLSEFKNYHKNSNEQQNPGCANNNPRNFFGDINTNKKHE
jgi:hypothetical protein